VDGCPVMPGIEALRSSQCPDYRRPSREDGHSVRDGILARSKPGFYLRLARRGDRPQMKVRTFTKAQGEPQVSRPPPPLAQAYISLFLFPGVRCTSKCTTPGDEVQLTIGHNYFRSRADISNRNAYFTFFADKPHLPNSKHRF
jgi:hypothetical protein